MEQLIIFLVLIVTGYTTGTIAEKRHYKSIADRESEHLPLPAVTFRSLPHDETDVKSAQLVAGSAVISLDYFKRFLAALRNIFGGEVKSYGSLVDRARREAVLRMKEKAHGADIVVNMRIETSAIGQSADKRKAIGSIEALAYGTAIYLKERS